MSPAETTLARVRAISEGKLKLPTLRTVPLTEFAAAPATSEQPESVYRYATINQERKGESL